MSKVFFDTNLFIYLLEDSGDRGARVGDLVQRPARVKQFETPSMGVY